MKRVLVVGGGVAGAAAAQRASERGATTTWVRGRAGASALGPGAADLTPWVDAESDERLSPELERFVAALGAWTCGAKSGLVVSAVGVVRPARARDPLVLDLTPHAGGALAVVTFPGAHGAGETLGSALAESGWARRTATRVRLVAVPDGATLDGEPPDLDAVYARLVATPPPDAWLVPARWLGDEARLAELSRRLGRPLGCPLTEVGGLLGARLWERLEAFAPASVDRVEGEVLSIEARASFVVAQVNEQNGSRHVEVDAALLCLGGLVGGGVVQDVRGRLRLALELPGVEFAVLRGERSLRLDPASPGGVDYCSLGHSSIASIGVLSQGFRLAPRVFAAGDLLSHSPHTALGAAQSAIDAVDELMG